MQLNETFYHIEQNMKGAETVKHFLSSTLIMDSLLKFAIERNNYLGFYIESTLHLNCNFLKTRLKVLNDIYIQDDDK